MKLVALGMAAVLGVGAVGVAFATPVAIQNGDFSQITRGATTSPSAQLSVINRTPPPASQQNPAWILVNDWAVSGSKTAQAIWYSSANAALNGPGGPLLAKVTAPTTGSGSFVALNGDTGGGDNPNIQASIQQQLTGLTVGGHYIVSFEWAAAQQTGVRGATTDFLRVSLGGQSHDTDTLAIATHEFSGWQSVSFGFTATSESALLKFLAFGTPAGAPPMALLTNVSIRVPEPSDFALFGGGLIMLGLMSLFARRRQARVTIEDDGERTSA